MKTLLIVYHTGGVKTAQIAEAVERSEEGVRVVVWRLSTRVSAVTRCGQLRLSWRLRGCACLPAMSLIRNLP